MGSMSLMHWFVFVEVAVLYTLIGIPVARIMRRVGRTGWWSILAIIPLVNLIGLWVFAFARWPTMDGPG